MARRLSLRGAVIARIGVLVAVREGRGGGGMDGAAVTWGCVGVYTVRT
jgi:hypothetical protein